MFHEVFKNFFGLSEDGGVKGNSPSATSETILLLVALQMWGQHN